MHEIDMSSEAITARLKLVSQLHRLCLSLKTAKIEPQGVDNEQEKDDAQKRAAEDKDRHK
jgi:hypothetical protein